MEYALPQGAYRRPQESYLERRLQQANDFTHLIPHKRTEFLPLFLDGVYGFTYPNGNYMAIDRDLMPEQKEKTEVHESIHTPDEYETRRLTEWMLLRDLRPYEERKIKEEKIN